MRSKRRARETWNVSQVAGQSDCVRVSSECHVSGQKGLSIIWSLGECSEYGWHASLASLSPPRSPWAPNIYHLVRMCYLARRPGTWTHSPPSFVSFSFSRCHGTSLRFSVCRCSLCPDNDALCATWPLFFIFYGVRMHTHKPGFITAYPNNVRVGFW